MVCDDRNIFPYRMKIVRENGIRTIEVSDHNSLEYCERIFRATELDKCLVGIAIYYKDDSLIMGKGDY